MILIAIDVDECAEDDDVCGTGSCENTPGNYTCQCLDGSSGIRCEAGKWHGTLCCMMRIDLALLLDSSGSSTP